jgi:hypothetical protein
MILLFIKIAAVLASGIGPDENCLEYIVEPDSDVYPSYCKKCSAGMEIVYMGETHRNGSLFCADMTKNSEGYYEFDGYKFNEDKNKELGLIE